MPSNFVSGMVFNESYERAPRFTLESVRLRHRRNIGVVVVVSPVSVLLVQIALDPHPPAFIDLIFPLMIELNDVGNCALSSIDSISRRSIQSSSMDSIESDDRLLNERKQLIDFGEMREAATTDASGDGFGGGIALG